MKVQRKAVGTNVPGAASSREQILEQRRKKREQRLWNKKEAAKEDDDDSDDDDDDSSEEGDITDDIEPSKVPSDVFYGNIVFGDGSRVTSDLSNVRNARKVKGPAHKDIKANLKKLEAAKEKMKAMSSERKAKELEKRKWKHAMASAEGEKVKDDEKLMKKALRRKEANKRRTKRDWHERSRDLHEEIKQKAERRMQNIWIRKENKGRSRKNQIKQLPSYKKISRATIKRARAGFEGRLKTGRRHQRK